MTDVPEAPAERFSPRFMRFLWARLLATAAQQMILVALGWQIYALTSSAWDLGLVGLMQFLPALVLTIPAGQLVDRVDRRRVIAAAIVIQFGVAFVLAWASAGNWVQRDLILGLSVAIGVARALQMPSQQAIIPSLVPYAQLARATAVSSAVMKLAIIGGPALGGFIYAAGAAVVYGVSAALLLASVIFVATIRRAAPPVSNEPVSLQSVLAGLRFVLRHKVLLGAISLDLFAVLLGGVHALLPMFAKDVLGTGPWAWACCVRQRRWAPWWSPSGSCGRPSRITLGERCSWPSRSMAWPCWSSASRPISGSRCWRSSSAAARTW